MRLTKHEDAAGRARGAPKTRRRGKRPAQPEETSDEDELDLISQEVGDDAESVSAMEREIRELEDEQVRRTNAYPGASNTIGSVHQRRWYLSLDRPACGFVEGKGKVWERDPKYQRRTDADEGTERCGLEFPFYVRGVDHERSIVTGRRGEDVLRDEGVRDFVQRKGWKPVLS